MAWEKRHYHPIEPLPASLSTVVLRSEAFHYVVNKDKLRHDARAHDRLAMKAQQVSECSAVWAAADMWGYKGCHWLDVQRHGGILCRPLIDGLRF